MYGSMQCRSTVTCINVCDLTKDGMNEIIVGRDDGRVEVYAQSVSSGGGMGLHPYKAFSATMGETVRSVRCGLINSADYNEVVVAGYSGKLLSYTSEPVQQRSQEDSYGRTVQSVSNENRIRHMRKEIEELQLSVNKEKEKLKKLQTPSSSSSKSSSFASFLMGGTSNSSSSSSSSTETPNVVSLGAQDFPCNHCFVLDTQQAAYVLVLTQQLPKIYILNTSSLTY